MMAEGIIPALTLAPETDAELLHRLLGRQLLRWSNHRVRVERAGDRPRLAGFLDSDAIALFKVVQRH